MDDRIKIDENDAVLKPKTTSRINNSLIFQCTLAATPVASCTTVHNRAGLCPAKFRQLVAEHYPRFVDLLADQDRSLPEYVQHEFDDFLKCGILEHGSVSCASAARIATVSAWSPSAASGEVGVSTLNLDWNHPPLSMMVRAPELEVKPDRSALRIPFLTAARFHCHRDDL